MLITIDGGTTNTRLSLLDGNTILSGQKLTIGARLSGDDRQAFLDALKISICELLRSRNLEEDRIEAIVCSGMITCESGLCEIPHLAAPCGIQDLARGLQVRSFPEVSSLPFYLVPGIRKNSTFYEEVDVMRGEETELFGICEQLDLHGSFVLVLPGSHSKIIRLDEEGKITDFCTQLTGEMLSSIVSGTILAKSLCFDSAALTNRLYDGYSFTETHGLNQALFKVRVLRQFMNESASDAYSFFLGAILHDEIKAINSLETDTVYIGGKKELKQPEALLLKRFTEKKVYSLSDTVCENAPAFGAKAIYEKRTHISL